MWGEMGDATFASGDRWPGREGPSDGCGLLVGEEMLPRGFLGPIGG